MAYDELDSLRREKTFAKRAIIDLLQCKKKAVVDGFKTSIDNAKSSNEISRIMIQVRRAI